MQDDTLLEGMWESHKDFLRRMLIGLARDIDLADDLLQETYLKAREGFAGYQGGDGRAWLAAIAKNAYFSHKRRRYVRYEILPDEDFDAAVSDPDPLTLIEIRQAIADLPENLRTALVMKHYGGYSYHEISERMHCPEGTAKSRVNLALKRLRTALSAGEEERIPMKCAELTDRLLLDFVYGKLDETKRKTVEEHLRSCKRCPGRAKEIGEVLRALDELENEFKMTSIVEIREDGQSMSYWTLAIPCYDEGGTIGMGDMIPDCFFINGKEESWQSLAEEAGEGQYRLHLPEYVKPGDRVDLLVVASQHGREWVKELEDGRRRVEGNLHLTEKLFYVMAIRLPAGAEIVTTSPEPSEVRRNCTTTVIWRNVMQPDERTDFVLEYRP
jgi:RNA polymerase sigma-70 factor (ECF subfamily)